MSFANDPRPAAERGYGLDHRRKRAAIVARIKRGEVVLCVLCGEPVTETNGRLPAGLHLDHTPDRTGYRGAAHNACNVRDGAARGGRRARPPSTKRRIVL